MRPLISIRGSVRPSVGPSVPRSVGPLVRNAFFFINCKNEDFFLHVCDQGGPGTSQKCRIASLQEGMSVGLSLLSSN